MATPIVIKNLFKGITKTYLGGSTTTVEGQPGEYARSNGIDLFRPGFVGHISPAQIFNSGSVSDGSANINSIPLAATVDVRTTPAVYYITGGLSGTAPRIIKTDISDTYQANNAISAHAGHNFTTIPTGTGYWGEDLLYYKANVSGTSKTCIFYTWNDNTDGDIGRYDIDANTYIDNFVVGTLSGSALTANVPHRIVEGPDKIAYITNGQYISSFDGATGNNGTFTTNAYDLGAGWIATDIRVDKNYLVIAGVRTNSFNYYSYYGKSKVAYWIPGEVGGGIIYDIEDSFVSAIFKYAGQMIAFTIGKSGTTKLIPVGSEKSLTEYPSGAYGTPPKPNSIDIYDGNLTWLPGDSSGGFALSYNAGGGLHVPMTLNDGSTAITTGGLLKNIQSNQLYLGGSFGASYKVVYNNSVNSGYDTNGTTGRDLRTDLYRLPFRATIDKIQVFFSQMASGSSAQISFFKNYTNSSIGTTGVDLFSGHSLATMTQSVDGTLNEREIQATISDVSSFYLNFRLKGQISIAEVLVYWH